MARLYSRKKGKSKSTRPVNIDNSEWTNKDVKLIKQTILDFAKDGKSASEIGMILRDSYAVPDVKALLGIKLGKVLIEGKITHEVPEDLLALIRKDISLAKHRETNHKDMTSKRGQQLTLSKINKLVTYYKSKQILAENWTYDRVKAVQWIV
jgi:small subunit ribosomal protein S15